MFFKLAALRQKTTYSFNHTVRKRFVVNLGKIRRGQYILRQEGLQRRTVTSNRNILGVNPFNQPGVEAYKKNMFALLNKPGYEKESEAIRAKLK